MECDTGNAEKKTSKSIVDAIHEKYSPHEEDTVVEIFISKRHSTMPSDSEGNILVPKEISLEGYGITCTGALDKLSSLCKHVTFLDLSENNISDWREIYETLDVVPKCQFLVLRHNPLDKCVCQPVDKKVYPQVQQLVLNRTSLPWEAIVKVLGIFTQLEELHLSLNDFSSVDLPSELVYSPLKSLHFNGNQVKCWEDFNKLSWAFPNLENLVMMLNPVTCLSCCPTTASFQNLKSINLNQTLMHSWADVEKLREFPQLTELRLQEIPLLEEQPKELTRQLILAYLPNIQRLNGSTVQDADRDAAERAFLRYEPANNIESHRQSPRFTELKVKHGDLEPLPLVDLHLQDKVKVTFICSKLVFEKEIETRWTVSELKLSLQPHVRIPWKRMRLWHEENDGHTTSLEELKSISLPISRYGVTEGDEIMIDQS